MLNACFLCGKDDEKEELTKLAELVKLDSEDAEEGEAPADNIVKGETAIMPLPSSGRPRSHTKAACTSRIGLKQPDQAAVRMRAGLTILKI